MKSDAYLALAVSHLRVTVVLVAGSDVTVLCFAVDQVGPDRRHAVVADPSCAVRAQKCNLQSVTLVLIVLVGALLILYMLLCFFYMWRAFRDLQKHQYMHYKMGNLVVRMQV